MTNLGARTSTTARWSPSTTRPASSSPTSAAPTTTRRNAIGQVPAPVRRRRRRLAPARVGVQAVQLRDRHQRQDDDRRDDVHGRRRRTSAAREHYTPTDADNLERGPVRVRERSPVLAQHPGRQGPRHQRRQPRRPDGQAVRHGVPARHADRPASSLDARHPGGPPGRPRDGLRRPWPTAASDIGHTTILRSQGPSGSRPRLALQAAGRHAGRQPAGGLHRHRHPGRQHRPQGQPVLGRLQAHRDRRHAPAGDAQDRHQQRRQGPQRLRLHRAAHDRRAERRAVRPRRRARGTATATTRSSARRRTPCSRSTSPRSSGRASSRRPPRPGRSTSSPSRPAS